jgi:SagB-type dehydrogenase family enzyme
MLANLARPRELSELYVDGSGPSVDVARATLSLLIRARMVVAAGEEQEEPLAHWSATDLLFHARSRVGSNVGGYGGTYHLRDRIPPLPAIKAFDVPAVALDRPDLSTLVDDDVPFTRVIEERHSVRDHDDARPISAEELGHFLFRSARVRARFDDGSQQLSNRPYPGGGAVYELELYPLVHHCADLAPGLYHYDPAAHALDRIAEPGPKLTLLCEYGRRTAVMDTPPQVLILLAARFARAMWKYESMAYALVLKDVGVLYQTMYLVATAMGLAPCALGGGNSTAFADAAGVDPYVETTVGEFVLGSRDPAARRIWEKTTPADPSAA